MMKKLTFLFLMAGTLSVWAANPSAASFSVQLTGGTRTCVASFAQDAMYTSGQDAQDILAIIGNTTTAVNIYGMAPFGKLSNLVTNNLNGTFIGLTTNGQTSYKLNFDLVTGSTLYIRDHVNDSLILVAPATEYVFTAATTQTINDRFEIVDPNAPVEGVVCFSYNTLQVTGNVGDLIKLTLSNGATQILSLSATSQNFDLSAYPKGRTMVEFDGKTYIINIGLSGTVVTDTPSSDLEPGGDPSNPIDL